MELYTNNQIIVLNLEEILALLSKDLEARTRAVMWGSKSSYLFINHVLSATFHFTGKEQGKDQNNNWVLPAHKWQTLS